MACGSRVANSVALSRHGFFLLWDARSIFCTDKEAVSIGADVLIVGSWAPSTRSGATLLCMCYSKAIYEDYERCIPM